VKLPVKRPPLILHVGDANNVVGDEVNSPPQTTEPVAYPEPERTTDEPGPPLVGVKIKVDVTVNTADAESPVLPRNIMEG
jgi:hypothetical protein